MKILHCKEDTKEIAFPIKKYDIHFAYSYLKRYVLKNYCAWREQGSMRKWE